MTFFKRALVLAGIITLTASTAGITIFSLSGCRTSEQSRRGIAASRAVPNSQLDRQLDSLKMVQAKLVEVIDSMTNLVEGDQDRIKALEADLAMLRSRIEGPSLPEPPPDSRREYKAPSRGFTARPPQPNSNGEVDVYTPPAAPNTQALPPPRT